MLLTYRIEVSGAPGPCFYVEPGDEDDTTELHTTADIVLASSWPEFAQATAALRIAAARHPARQFRIKVGDA